MGLTFYPLPICVGDVTLHVARGHFATSHSHVNYLIDITPQKASLREANAVAEQLASTYLSGTLVDAILCLDGTRVIGTCLAQKLTQPGFYSMNAGRDIDILRVELDGNGKIIFRDNAKRMIQGKNVLILMSSVTTGETAERSIEGVTYYGGRVSGLAAIYSCIQEVQGLPITALFNCADLPDYASYSHHDCPLCRKGVPLDAVVNSFGYSKL